MSESMGLTVVLPAYNEEDNIVPLLEEALAELEKLRPHLQQVCRALEPANLAQDNAQEKSAVLYEIIVVNDGSRDDTGKRADEMAQKHPELIRCLSHETNLGYGAALRRGFDAARYPLVFYTDSDRQFSIGDLRYFLPHIIENDLVVGFRVYRYDPLLRLFLSWGYNRLVRLLFRVRVRDVDCSFKLMRREVLESIDLETNDFFIDTELVARARRWNFRIFEKGVKHYPRQAGESSLRPSHVPRTLNTVFRMWWRIHFGHWSPKGKMKRQ
ncbi:MAG TPA: glycosyltransferase family 2 protein [bacterium]|nr:glycosyltransferase family 2 protein [bacterium]HQL62480.1 glycosyltransferase family 2 protein [bacterium]